MFDIAVVGAGPAAATFARKMNRQGKSILIIDGQDFTGEKPCGGLLAPDAQKQLARSDITLPREILVDPQILSVRTMDLCTRKVRHYQRCYINMDRRRFDEYLLSRVNGDATIVKGRCVRILKAPDGSFQLDVSEKGTVRTFLSLSVVGADGANSLVRKTFYPGAKIYQYIAIQQWFAYEGSQVPFYSCVFDRKTSGSCSWTIHKDHYMIYGGCFEQKNCKSMFEKQKARLSAFMGIPFGEPEKTQACLVNRPRRMKDFVTGAGGVFLIGEAAGFISPSSFEGISYAIESGAKLAGAFKTGESMREIAASYKKSTFSLRCRLWLKMRKRWFMYTPIVRRLIMLSGLAAISVEREEQPLNP